MSPSEISVMASANFFCMSCVCAKGRLNCFLSIVYCRAMATQASAAPSAPHAILCAEDDLSEWHKQIRQLIIAQKLTHIAHCSNSQTAPPCPPRSAINSLLALSRHPAVSCPCLMRVARTFPRFLASRDPSHSPIDPQ